MPTTKEINDEFRQNRDQTGKKAREAMDTYVKEKSKLDHGEPSVVSPTKLEQLKQEAERLRKEEVVWDDRLKKREGKS
jgi:FtsZ-binding cell division protein ZapB